MSAATLVALLAGCPATPPDTAKPGDTETPAPDTGETGPRDSDVDSIESGADSGETGEPDTGDTTETGDTGDSGSEVVACDRSLPWKAVEAGSFLTCGIHTDGCAECWGIGEDQDVGDEAPGYKYRGEDKPPAGAYSAIDLVNSQGDEYQNTMGSCGLLTDGSMVCWGWTAWTDPGPYVAIGVRDVGEYALTAAGDLVSWDDAGVPSDGTFTTLSIGEYDAMAIQPDGTIRRWAPQVTSTSLEETIPGVWTAASVGEGSCAIDSLGEVTCWDDFWNIQPFSGDSNPPGPFTDICVTGDYTACALDPSGAPTCWGIWPDVVDGTPTGTTLTQISCGLAHVCGVTPEGEILCWGTNTYGECDPPL